MAQYDSVFKSMYHLCETIGSGALQTVNKTCFHDKVLSL